MSPNIKKAYFIELKNKTIKVSILKKGTNMEIEFRQYTDQVLASPPLWCLETWHNYM